MISPITMIPALISIHPNAAPSGAGVVHGVSITPFPTMCNAIQVYAIIEFTTGTKINGIIIIGFNTIGKPKMIGSLILKIAGPIESLPKVRNSTDFALSSRIHNHKVAPPPPNVIIYDQNG